MGLNDFLTPNDQGIDLDSKQAAKLMRSPEERAVIYDGKEYSSFSSSNVASFWYDYEQSELYVRFLSGAVYIYHAVPEQIVVSFMRASSKGRFVYYALRDHYSYHRIH